MRIACLQHVDFEGPARIGTWAEENRAELQLVKLWAGDRLPTIEDLDWLIVLGGPMSVSDEDQHPWLGTEKRLIEAAVRADRPVVGICLGAQLLAEVLGARIYSSREPEIGWFPVKKASALTGTAFDPVFPQQFMALHWHAETFGLPEGSIPIGSTAVCDNQGFIIEDHVIALQFHLEMDVTGAEQLIEHCAGEMVSAPFVQATEDILIGPRYFAESNALMFALLDHLYRRRTGRVASER